MIKSNSTFAIFVKVEPAYSAYLVAFVRQSSASLFLLCYRVARVTCGMSADGGILQEFGEFAERAGGWAELLVQIHKVLPEVGERRDLDTSRAARDDFKRELTSLSSSKIRRLLEWGRISFPSSSESSNADSGRDETAAPRPSEPESSSVPTLSASSPAPVVSEARSSTSVSQNPEEEVRVRRMTRALQRVLFGQDDPEVAQVSLHPMMHFATQYPLRRPSYPRSEKRSLLAGLPEVRGVARPQRWHPVLDAAASTPALRAAAKEATVLSELRSDILRCLSIVMDALPGNEGDAPTHAMCAVLAAAGILEIHISASLRATRDQLLTAAQSGQPMEASKYFKAMLSVEDGSSEFIGSELSALRNIEDLQLTGLVRGELSYGLV